MELKPFSEAYTEFSWWTALAVVGVYILVDWAWARYTLATAAKNTFAAANWSLVIYLTGAFGVLLYVENWLYIVPSVVGGYIGSWYGTSKG